MSRTFEVLERLQQDRELLRVPRVAKATPTIAAVPGKLTLSDCDAYAREEVLKLVQSLFLGNSEGDGSRRVVFCGVDQGPGSNVLCARAGSSLSEQVGSQICVVDANLRAPTTSPLFALPSIDKAPQSRFESTQNSLRRVADNLCLLSGESIRANGGSRTLEHLLALIRELSAEFMYWIIGAAPIGLCRDATLLGQVADGAVLVVEANSTRREAALKAKEALERANVRLLGVVLNNRRFPIPQRVYRRL
jgi:hypothetical protein